MRLAAQAKGGFYPTPDRVVEMIATLLETPRLSYYSRGKTLRVLDPCCGAGEAVARLAGAMAGNASVPVPIETFGVELHKDRAEEAKVRLDHALASDLFRTSMANGSFGLLYLNPPYDWDSGDERRVGHRFLTHCTRYLAEDGLLVFIVPGSGWRCRPDTWPPTTRRSAAGHSPGPSGRHMTRWCSWVTGRRTHPPTPTPRGG